MKPIPELTGILVLAPFLFFAQSFTKFNNTSISSKQGDLHSVSVVDFDNNYTLDIFIGKWK